MPKAGPKKLDAREDRFVDEFLVSLKPEEAAIKAGYSPRTARTKSYQWVSNRQHKPHVFDEIQKRKTQRAEETGIDQVWVLKKLVAIADADASEITRIEIGCCRYCHGVGHQYQWRTEDEFQTAQEEHFALPDNARSKAEAPVIAGGYGYRPKKAPHKDCPRCDGYGRPRTVLADTSRLSPEAKALFAGVKETANGVEIKTQDKMKAIDMIARHVGFFEKDNAQAAGPIAEAIGEIQKRMAGPPIRRDEPGAPA